MSLRGTKRAAGVRGEEAGASKRRRTEAEDALWQLRPVSDLKMSSIYNRSASEAPAELFRKDLISAMKLPDNEPLTQSSYWIITDTWKQDWERGVQVPVNPDSLPAPKVKIIDNPHPPNFQEFKLPKDKYLHLSRDAHYLADKHFLSLTPALAEANCSYDLDSTDTAWLKLLNAERARAGASPVSEDQLEKVIEELEIRTWDKIQAIMKSEEGLGIEYDENVICDVCRSPDSEDGNEMVFCDSCNICVHQACYGITVIPAGQWLCRPCGDGVRPSCVLCPNHGGAMKCTPSGHKWAHVSCVLWIPEVSIGCAEIMEPITKISSIPASRWSLVCVLCRNRKGACIQCSVKTCKTAYHVTCAFKHGLEMRAIIEDENADDGVKLRSYCQKHSVNTKKEKCPGSGSEEEEVKRKRRKDMTSEEKTQARAARLQEIEREFDRHVSVKDISSHLLDVDQDAINYIYNYWKLKRRAGHNRPLLPPKSDDTELLTHRQEQADLDKMKMFVQLRQDLERVRNLCYMVSRREKLSRSFFRMREQTFHKQVAVLSADATIPPPELAAIIEANHGPSIYDRLYSHPNAPDHKNDFEELLARIAPMDSDDEKKKDRNGLMKGSKSSNPYKKHYVNGTRRSGSMYSGLSSEESAPEMSRPGRYRKAIGSSTEDEGKKSSSSPKKKISPKAKAKRSPKKIERKKKKLPQSKPLIASSSEDEVVKSKLKKDRPVNKTLQQMEKEMAAGLGHSGTDSDDLMPIRSTRNNKFPIDIYSDSSEDDKSNHMIDVKNDKTKNEKTKPEKIKPPEKSPNGNDSQQSLPRTKAAMKEFIPTQPEKKTSSPEEQKPAPKKRGRKPSNKDKKLPTRHESDDEAKNKENIKLSKQKDNPTDLIVPQRQAAKKASENMRSTTAVKKDDCVSDKHTSGDEAKPKTPVKAKVSKGKEIKDSPPAKVSSKKSKETEKEPISYVPQRQAAKKAAAHIKSGLGSKPAVADEEAKNNAEKKKEPEKTDLVSPKKDDPKTWKGPQKESEAKQSSSSSSNSSSSSYSSSSSSDEEEPEKPGMKPTVKAREIKPTLALRPPSLFSPPGSRPTVDLPFLDRVSRPLSSTSASSDSDSSKDSDRPGSVSPCPKRPRRRRKGKSISTDTSPRKAPDKKLKTSERRSECRVPSPSAEGEEPSRPGNARAATRSRTRSTTSSGNMPNKSDARPRKPSKDEASFGSNKAQEEGSQPRELSLEKRKADEELKKDAKDDATVIESPKNDVKSNSSKTKRRESIEAKDKVKVPDVVSPTSNKTSPKKSTDVKNKTVSIRRMSVKEPAPKERSSTEESRDVPKRDRRPSTVGTERRPSTAATDRKPSAVAKERRASTVATDRRASTVATDHRASTVGAERRASTVATDRRASTVATDRRASTVATDRKASTVATDRRASTVGAERRASTVATDRKPSAVAKERRASPVATEHRTSSVAPDRRPSTATEQTIVSPTKKPSSVEKSVTDKKSPMPISADYHDSDKHWLPKAPSPTAIPPAVEKPGGNDKYMSDDKSMDSDYADKSSVKMIAKIQANLNENTMIKSPKTPMDARTVSIEIDVETVARNMRKRPADKKFMNQDASHVQGVEISKSAKIPSAANPYPNRSVFSPQPKDNEMFDFEMMAVDDGFNHEDIIKPFTYPEFFFKEDSKEQGVQETLNLVDRLRMQLSTKKVPVENSGQDEATGNDKEHREDEPVSEPVNEREPEVQANTSAPEQVVPSPPKPVNHVPHSPEREPSRNNTESNTYLQPIPMTSHDKWPAAPVTHTQVNDGKYEMPPSYDKEPVVVTDIQSVSEVADTISLSKQSDDSQSLSVVDHSVHSNDQELTQDNQNYDNNDSMIHSDCATISSPYIIQEKWRESKITTRRSSASSTNSEASVMSHKNELKGKSVLEGRAVSLMPEIDTYPPIPAYSRPVEPSMPLNQYTTYPASASPFLSSLPMFCGPSPLPSPGPALYGMPFATPPLLPSKPAFPLCAAFTSSSQNIAITTAMIAPPTPKPADSPREDADATGTDKYSMHASSPSASVDSYEAHCSNNQPVASTSTDTNETIPSLHPQESKSPTRPSKSTAKFPGKSPGKSSPGISPRQGDAPKGTKRQSNKNNRSQRGRGRSKSRGRGHGFPPVDYMGNSIQSKLVGTVYDFDEEIANDGVDLKALREKRKSIDVRDDRKSENSYKEASQSPPAASPPQNKKPAAEPKETKVIRSPEAKKAESSPSGSGAATAAAAAGGFSQVAPVLPGPVDMRTYQPSERDHLLAFASGTADQHLADIDEEVEKQLHSALRATPLAAPPPAPFVPHPRVSLSDSRNQLKVKIKGPFLDANYSTSSCQPVVPPPPAPVLDPAVPTVASVGMSGIGVAGGSTNLRRMRKKELLRQYWTQDMNMDDPSTSAVVPPPAAPAPQTRANVITIPKAVASMTSIPTRDDYNLDAPPEKKKRKTGGGLTRELRHLEVSMNDDVEPDEPRPSTSTAPAPAGGAGKRRGRGARKPSPAAPKLKIKLSANTVQQVSPPSPEPPDARPPKKRALAAAPCLEDLRRESMKYRKRVMQDFDKDEKNAKTKSKSEKRKKKKGKKANKLQVVNSESESATKLIIKIKRTKEEDRPPADSGPAESGPADSSGTSAVPGTSYDPFEYDPTAQDPLALDAPRDRVTPIRLKLSRSGEGSGYVMKEPEAGPSSSGLPLAHPTHCEVR